MPELDGDRHPEDPDSEHQQQRPHEHGGGPSQRRPPGLRREVLDQPMAPRLEQRLPSRDGAVPREHEADARRKEQQRVARDDHGSDARDARDQRDHVPRVGIRSAREPRAQGVFVELSVHDRHSTSADRRGDPDHARASVWTVPPSRAASACAAAGSWRRSTASARYVGEGAYPGVVGWKVRRAPRSPRRMSLLTNEWTAALARSDDGALVTALETVFWLQGLSEPVFRTLNVCPPRAHRSDASAWDRSRSGPASTTSPRGRREA
jgi:hypothetical protein